MIEQRHKPMNIYSRLAKQKCAPAKDAEFLKPVLMTEDIYPIYITSKLNQYGKINPETKQMLDVFQKAVQLFDLNVTIACYGPEAVVYHMAYPEFNIASHDLNSAKYASIEYIIPFIRKFVLEDFQSKDTYKSGMDYFYMFDDDLIFKIFEDSMSKDITISNPQDLVKFFCAWQYYGTKVAMQDIDDEHGIGIVGMPCVNPFWTTQSSPSPMRLDDTRVCQAILLNARACECSGVTYDTSSMLWEDFDIDIQLASKGLHTIGLESKIWFESARKMLSNSNNSPNNYNNTKLTKLSANLYRKWGKFVIPRFRTIPGNDYALNAKVESIWKWMFGGCPVEYDQKTLDNLDAMIKGNMTLAEFKEKENVEEIA